MMTRQQGNHFRGNMDAHFEGKVALITGASRGIGAATARLFAQERATVILASRSAEELARLVEEIKASEGEAMAVHTDVADATSLQALIQRTVDSYGRLDIAINNAGVASGNRPSWRSQRRPLIGSSQST